MSINAGFFALEATKYEIALTLTSIFLIISKPIFFPDKMQNYYVNRSNFQGGVFFGIGDICVFFIFKKSLRIKYNMETKYLSNAMKKCVPNHKKMCS